ncbi:MAG: thioesterase family protein [Gammaproteobacteria bacterium]|nr:thioesterase family protein [Gammaproteobacteria bacterium]
MFSHPTVIQLHHTDAAGILFFGRLFMLAHDAYQAFMAAVGLDLRRILEEGEYLLPIVHAEADFKAPLRVGDTVDIRVTVERLGQGSFTLAYEFVGEAGVVVATARTVHAAMAPGGSPMPLPAVIRVIRGQFT